MVSCLHFANHLELFRVTSVQGSFCLTGPLSGSLQLSSVQTNISKWFGTHLTVSGTITFGSASNPIIATVTPTSLTTNAHGQVLKQVSVPVSFATRQEMCQTIIASNLMFEVPHLQLEAKVPHKCLKLTCCATTCCDPFLVVTQGIGFWDGNAASADIYFLNLSSSPFTVQSIQVSVASAGTPGNFTDVDTTITGPTVIPPANGSSSVPSIPIQFTLPTMNPEVIIYKYTLAATPASDARVCQKGTGAIVPTFDGTIFIPQELP